ncbi:type II secretion system protein D [Endothiovibrio diazotrophicus]
MTTVSQPARLALLAAALALTAGCSLRPVEGLQVPAPREVAEPAPNAGGAAVPAAGTDGKPAAPAGPTIESVTPPQRGADTLEISGLKLPPGTIRINAEQMPLGRFVHYALGETLGLGYTLDEQVRKRDDTVTLFMTEELPAAAFLEVVRGLLAERGISLALQQGVIQVAAGKKNGRLPVGAIRIGRTPPPAGAGRLLQVIPVHHLNPVVLMKMLEQDVLLDASVEPMQQTTNLLVRGDAEEVARAVRYVQLLDRADLAGREPFLINLEHVGAEAFVTDLKRILAAEGVAVSDGGFQPGVLLIPLDGGKRVFAVTPDKGVRRHIAELTRRMDRPQSNPEAGSLYVYTPENRDAAELAEVIASLTHGGGAVPADGPTADERGPRMGGKPEKEERVKVMSRRVVVDKARNSLLIHATPDEYRSLLATLRELDTPPRQIFVEVTIAEVTLDGQLQFGVEWYLRERSGSAVTTLQTLGGLGVGSAGALFTFGRNSGDLSAVINALGKDRQVKILSRPRLMLHDNGNASINVGTEVPIITSEASTNDLNVDGTSALLRSVQYRTTGVGLEIGARILAKNLVSLSVSQHVSEAQTNNTSNIDSPIILDRSLTTEVEVRSGRSVLLGGLMSENESYNETKVPLIGDLPVVGNLFRSQSRGRVRTELLIQLQPVIVEQEREGDRLLEQLESSLADVR